MTAVWTCYYKDYQLFVVPAAWVTEGVPKLSASPRPRWPAFLRGWSEGALGRAGDLTLRGWFSLMGGGSALPSPGSGCPPASVSVPDPPSEISLPMSRCHRVPAMKREFPAAPILGRDPASWRLSFISWLPGRKPDPSLPRFSDLSGLRLVKWCKCLIASMVSAIRGKRPQ